VEGGWAARSSEADRGALSYNREDDLKIVIKIRGSERTVEISSPNGHAGFSIDGRAIDADVVQIAPTLYSILMGTRSFEVHIKEVPGAKPSAVIAGHEYPFTIRDDRQWRRRRGAALEVEGKQQVIASMPGKIVRLLVSRGESVKLGQGLMVIEAMKMQNEVRSPKSGTVERLVVKEGQAVNVGETLAVVD
jgi:biotin carboxyl carrier protein